MSFFTSAARRRGLLLASAIATCPAPALAQQAAPAESDGSLADIIVTAQKRAEPLQRTPISITAVPQDVIDKRGIKNLEGLTQLAPNVTVNHGFLNPSQISPTIRGIGTFNADPLADPPIAVSIDGVYMASVFGALINTFELDQIEVLRGPQGTLQGRGATGGAFNITTKRPSGEFGGRVEIGFGRFNEFLAQGSIEAPIVQDKLAAKLAVVRNSGGGYMKNLTSKHRFGGRDSWTGRIGLLFTPSDRITVYGTADLGRDRSPQPAVRAANTAQAFPRPETPAQTVPLACSLRGFCVADPIYTARADFTDRTHFDTVGTTLNADIDLGAATFTSVTGYRHVKELSAIDFDRTPLPIFTIRKEDNKTVLDQFSQEVRLASNADGGADFGGAIKWLVGAYYLNFKLDRLVTAEVLGSGSPSLFEQELNTYALFGHLDVMPFDGLTLSAGARPTWDKKNFHEKLPVILDTSKSFRNFSMEAGIQYEFTPQHMVYARFSQGYIPGGFTQTGIPFDPEELDSYELGFKTQWFNRHLQVNGAVFQYKYKNLQRISTRQIDAPPFFISVPSNVGRSTIKGVELEIAAMPVTDFRIQGSVGYLDAKYDRYDVAIRVPPSNDLVIIDNSGLRLPNAPRWTISASMEKVFRIIRGSGELGTFTPAINFTYRSKLNVAGEDLPVSDQSGYAVVNGTLRFADPDDRYTLTLYMNNITNKHYIVEASRLGGVAHFRTDAPPRTYGVRVAARF